MEKSFSKGDFICYLHYKEDRFVGCIVKELSPFMYLIELCTFNRLQNQYERYEIEAHVDEIFPLEMVLENEKVYGS